MTPAPFTIAPAFPAATSTTVPFTSGTVNDRSGETAGVSAIAVTPRGNKADRLRIQSAKFEAGRVLLPGRAPWLSDLVTELLSFPSGRHDDQVDSVSQALADEATIEPVQIAIYSFRKGWIWIPSIADRNST